MLRTLARRFTHWVVFKHRWRPCVLLVELSGMSFAYDACEMCFYYDPMRPKGVYAAEGTDVWRIVVADLHEGATIQ